MAHLMETEDPQVRRLKKYLQDKHASKEAYEAALAKAMARQKEVDAAPWEAKTDFYCKCHGDFTAKGGKVVEGRGDDIRAYYVPIMAFPAMFVDKYGRHKFGRPCKAKRYITDKAFDPYYHQSPIIIRQQRKAAAEGWFLQPGQAGFNAKYGDPFKQQYAKLEQEERRAYELRKNAG